MRHRRNFILGGFALALLSTSALGGQAHAQGATLQPVSGWSATSVPNKGDASYCAVARRFDGNVILTVARNKRNETSVALDFDAAQFEKENRFNISLDPGAGAQRNVIVKPASEKAFVLKLGKDEGFYNALLKTGFLRTEIGEKGYNFNLSDIAAGKESLTTCLSQIGIPDMPQEAFAPAAAADPKLEELSQRLARLETENRQLKNDQVLKGGMTPEFPLERVALKPLNDMVELAPVGAPPAAAKAPAALASASAPAPAKAKTAAPAFAAASPGTASGSIAKVDPSLLAGMAEENRRLKEMLEQKSAAPAADTKEIAALNQRLKKLEKDNKALAHKLENSETQLALAATGPEISREDSRTITELRKENDRLVASLAALQTAAGDESAASPLADRDTERKLAILENQNRVLTERLDTLLGQNGDYARLVARYESQVAELERKLSQPQRPEGPDYAAMVEALKEEIAAVQSENITLREEKSRPDPAMEREISKLKAENELLNKEVVQVQAQMLDLKTQKARPDPKLEGEIAALKAENELLNKEIVQAQSEVFTLKNQKPKADPKLEGEIAALKTENEVIGQQLAQLQSENLELKLKTQGPDYAAMVESLKGQLEKAQADVAVLKSSQTVTDVELEGQIAALRTENELLNLEIARQSELAHGEFGDKLAALQAENEILQQRLAGYLGGQGSLVALRNEMEGIKAQKDELSSTMADIKAQTERLAALEKENAALKQAAMDDKALTLADYEDRLDKLTLENESMRTALDELQTAQADVSTEAEALREENAALLARLDESENVRLQAQAERDAAVEADAPAEDIASLNERIEALNQENEALKKELSTAQIALVSLKDDAGADVSAELEKALSEIPGQPAVAAVKAEGATLALDITEGAPAIESDQESGAVSLDEPLPSIEMAAAESAGNEGAEITESADSADSAADNNEAAVELAQIEAVPPRAPAADAARKTPVPTVKPAMAAVLAKAAPPVSAPAPVKENVAAADGPAADGVDPAYLAAIETAAGDDMDPERLLEIQEQQALEMGLTEAQRQEMAMSREVGGHDSSSPVAAHAAAVAVKEGMAAGAALSDAIEQSDIQTEILVDPENLPATGGSQVLARVSDTGGHPEGTSDVLVPDLVVSEGQASDEPLPPAKSVQIPLPVTTKSAAEFSPAMPIENILSAAQIPVEGTVKMLSDMSGPNFHAYQWHSKGGLFGSAQQKPLKSEGQFDDLVQDYLTQTERRCQGDFAIDPSGTQEAGGTRIDTYEIACVGGDVDSTASLLFVSQGGTFTVVAHESPAAAMQSAMDYRDRMVASLRRS